MFPSHDQIYASRDADAGYEVRVQLSNYLDSPNTLSEITYKVYWAKSYGTQLKTCAPYVVDTGNFYTNAWSNQMSAMEISA